MRFRRKKEGKIIFIIYSIDINRRILDTHTHIRTQTRMYRMYVYMYAFMYIHTIT